LNKKDNLKKCLYTANIGDYDNIINPNTQKLDDWDYICFTDNKELKSNYWTIVYVKKPNDLSNVKFARYIKINFHKIVPDYYTSIWIDSNIMLNTNLNNFLSKYALDVDLVVSKHYKRDCIYFEANVIMKLNYDSKHNVLNQINKYELDNYPTHNGLAETNVLVRNNTPEIVNFCDLWWNEVNTYTHRDQLSFNYVLWKYPINIKIIKSPIRFDNLFSIKNHKKTVKNSVAVVMCTWNRIERLETTIKQLEQQTYTNFDFYIWNNNYSKKDEIDNIISDNNLNILIHHSKINVKGFGRFNTAKNIKDNYPVIIFIDDDFSMQKTVINRFISAWKPDMILGWWAWKIYNNNYFDRIRVNDFEDANYVGTAAMVLDSDIFNCDKLFECPKEFLDIEDLWLNFIANHHLNWQLKGLYLDANLNKDDKDMSELNSEYLNDKKQHFLEYLINQGWKL